MKATAPLRNEHQPPATGNMRVRVKKMYIEALRLNAKDRSSYRSIEEVSRALIEQRKREVGRCPAGPLVVSKLRNCLGRGTLGFDQQLVPGSTREIFLTNDGMTGKVILEAVGVRNSVTH